MSFLAWFLKENFVLFSYACSILELLLCNRNLTTFDILTLLGSDCRARALKLSEHLKKKHIFFCQFCQLQFKHSFCTFPLTLKKILSYLKSSLNLCDEYHVLKISTAVIKVVKSQIFNKAYLPLKPTLRSCFFSCTEQL